MEHASLGIAVAASLVLALRVSHDSYYIASRRQERFGLGWNRLSLPIDAVRYAGEVGLAGPVLNHLNFGGYLMWARSQPVFIDGRLEVAGEEFYRYYQRVLSSDAELEACVSKHGIEWMIFPYATYPRLLARLSKDVRWRLAYLDHLSVIFVRDGPRARSFVDPRLALELGPVTAVLRDPVASGDLPGIGQAPRLSGARRWLSGVMRRQDFPSDDFYRGLFHYFRTELDPAERRFASAIRKSAGAYYEIYNNLAAVLYQKRKFREAAQCYRVVLAEDPENRIARERLASMPR